MARSELEILVELTADEAERNAKKLRSALGKVSDEADGTDSALSGLQRAMNKTGLSFTVTAGDMANWGREAARIVVDTFELGNAIERTGKTLEVYAGGADEAAEATQAIIAATDNGLRGFAAQRAAVDLLGRGLAKTADEAAQLARIAAVLGDSTLTTSERMSSFNALLANQSIERLDTFGLSAGQVRERMAELAQEAGAGTQTMQFFGQAVLELGSEKLAALEANGITAASSTDQLRAKLEDLRNTMSQEFAARINIIIDASGNLVDALGASGVAAVESGKTFDEWVASLPPAVQPLVRLANKVREVGQSVGQATDEYTGLSLAQSETIKEAYNLAQAFALSPEVRLIENLRELGPIADATASQLQVIETRIRAAAEGAVLFGPSIIPAMQESSITAQQFGNIMEATGDSIAQTGDAAATAAPQIAAIGSSFTDIEAPANLRQLSTTLGEINTNVSGTIENMLEQIAFLQAGGGEIIAFVNGLSTLRSQGLITDEELAAGLSSAYVESQELLVSLNEIKSWQAERNIEETLGISEAKGLMDGIVSTTDQLARATVSPEIAVRVTLSGNELAIEALGQLLNVNVNTFIAAGDPLRSVNNNSIPATPF